MSIYEMIHTTIQSKASDKNNQVPSTVCQHCGDSDDCLLVFSYPKTRDSWLCSSCYSKAQTKTSLWATKNFNQRHAYQYQPMGS